VTGQGGDGVLALGKEGGGDWCADVTGGTDDGDALEVVGHVGKSLNASDMDKCRDRRWF